MFVDLWTVGKNKVAHFATPQLGRVSDTYCATFWFYISDPNAGTLTVSCTILRLFTRLSVLTCLQNLPLLLQDMYLYIYFFFWYTGRKWNSWDHVIFYYQSNLDPDSCKILSLKTSFCKLFNLWEDNIFSILCGPWLVQSSELLGMRVFFFQKQWSIFLSKEELPSQGWSQADWLIICHSSGLCHLEEWDSFLNVEFRKSWVP